MALLGDALVGAVVGQLLKAVLDVKDKAVQFKPTLKLLEATLKSMEPLAKKIDDLNKQLDRPKEETEGLIELMRNGEKLVLDCSKVPWWNFGSKADFQKKLADLDKSIVRFFDLNMQAQISIDLKELLAEAQRNRKIESMGLCSPPKPPAFTVGFDVPLQDLKSKLLRDHVSVVVQTITGIGGSGKSTLAKMFCWDEQVQDRFGRKIFYVVVSKTPNWKTIIQTLFDQCGLGAPQFQSDEDATNRLELLLRQVGAEGTTPILLVLDDVWPGSEARIEKFKFDISNYRILVTSRVAFPRFGNAFNLKPLVHDDAVLLFRHFAQLDTSSCTPIKNLVEEIVRGCKGSPLALEVIGGNLCKQPFEVWKITKERLKDQSILESNDDLLKRLQNCLDILEDESSIKEKECFMDLGLFPEDQRIYVPALIDMWSELHELDEDGTKAMNIILSLANKNLVSVKVTRKVAMDTDLFYNNHFLTQHDLLRELAVHQSNQEPFEQRERLMIDLNENNLPEWWIVQNQQGIISRMLSSFLPIIRWMEQKPKQVVARVLSISTDETFTSDWCNILPDKAEVLVLNIHSSNYTLPQFTDKMSELKVLIVTNYSFHPSELNKFELLGYLPYLKRIRLENVSVPSLCKLQNLQKLSLYRCNTRKAFESSTIPISDALPNLVEMNIDYCYDLVELPSEICKITTLKKLSITNCHKLSTLPQEIGKLENLEVLMLSSCTGLQEMPESVGRLCNLRCLGVSDCLSLKHLPEDIGGLHCIEKLYMWGCSRLNELPYSVMKLGHLKHVIYVICDEEGDTLWKRFPDFPNLKIEISQKDISLNWLSGVLP